MAAIIWQEWEELIPAALLIGWARWSATGLLPFKVVSKLLAGLAVKLRARALDATGAGAVVGIPLNVASAGVIVHGAATGTTGVANLGKAVISAFSNPHGSPGAPDYQQKVGELVDKAKSEAKPGEKVESNTKLKDLDS